MFGPVRGTAPSFLAVRMAFSLDQGLQLTVCGPVATSISRTVLRIGSQGNSCSTRSTQRSPFGRGVGRCSSLSRLISCSADVRGVSILGDIAPEAFFLSLQLLDMSHRRWSSFNASVALEFGDNPSRLRLSSPASCSRRGIWTWLRSSGIPLPLGPDLRNQCALHPACSQLPQRVSTDFGLTTP